ncbi:hypothetical protein ABPG72_002681 [Tetrahymena utriculariae]
MRQQDTEQSLIPHAQQYQSDLTQNLEIRRWFILAVFSLFSFSNASGFVTYSPIIQQSQDFYNTSQQNILWLANCYYLTYTFLAIPTLYFFRWRLDFSLIIGAFLNALGGWLRYIGNDQYTFAIMGQIVLSIAQLFILPAPVFIAERWFGMSERVTATGIMYFGNVLGVSFGFLTSVYYVTDSSKLNTYLFYMAICLSLAAPFSIFVFKNKPTEPANQSSSNTNKIDVIQTVKMIFTSPKTLLITVSLSLYLGISWTLISIIDILLSDYGNQQIALIGLCINVSGTISGTTTTYLLDKVMQKGKKPNYDLYLRLFATISLISIFIFSLMLQLGLQDNNKVIIYIICAFIGVGFQAFIPISAQSFLENLYPMHEVTCFSTFNIFANILGFIGNMVTSIDGIGTAGAWILVGMIIPLYVYLVFNYKTNCARFDYEINQNEKSKQIDQVSSYSASS